MPAKKKSKTSKVKRTKRVDSKNLFFPGDGKGFVIMVLCLILVVVSVLSVKALNKTQEQAAEDMEIFLMDGVQQKSGELKKDKNVGEDAKRIKNRTESQYKNIDSECRAEVSRVELSNESYTDCYKSANVVCSNGITKEKNLSSSRAGKTFCLSQAKWEVYGETFCKTRKIANCTE